MISEIPAQKSIVHLDRVKIDHENHPNMVTIPVDYIVRPDDLINFSNKIIKTHQHDFESSLHLKNDFQRKN